jgi:multidrug efflux pump subunit AcrB
MNAPFMHPTASPPPQPGQGGLARYFVEHREVGWLALVAVLVWGFFSYRMLPQQEDPVLPGRIARVVGVLPGATAARVEQLVTRAIEKKIAELETIEEMSSETREGVVIITLGQRSAPLARTEQEWDKLRAKLTEVTLPEGAWAPQLQTDFGDVTTLLLGVTGAAEGGDRALEVAADRLEDELKQIPSVGRARKLGVVNETVHLLFSPDTLNQHGLSLFRITEALKQRNQLVPSGTFHSGPEDLPVQLSGEFRDEADVRAAIVGTTPESLPIRLGDVMDVRRGYEEPRPFHIDVFERREGELGRSPSVILTVEMKSGQVIGEFSRSVREAIDRVQPQLAKGLRIVTVSDQPKSVERRLEQFGKCFGEAVLVVIFVALLLMEWRAAVIVALAIPLTIAMTLGGMALAGIPLHQISIAALIIALGMLVDDPVVAADGINRELAQGQPRETAAWLGPFKLRRAILFATIINIFAFLPLVLLPGDKKSFIYALPVVVTISLIASRIVSMTFIPLLGYYVLRGQRGFDRGGWLARLYRPVLEDALRRPWVAVLLAYGLLAASLTVAPRLGRQFFPPAERHQLLVDIALPESAPLARTDEVCGDVFRLLKSHEEIESGAIFIGGSGPRFYYNVTPKAPADHLAQVLINTHTAEEVPALVAKLRAELDREIAGARCVVKRLEQGPPVDTPIQIRLTGDDLETLRALAGQVSAALRDARAYQVHDDLGSPLPTLDLTIDQDRAGALGVVNASIGAVVRSAFAGLKLTELREGARLVPVMLRLRPEESGAVEKIREIKVESLAGPLVPLREFATVERHAAFATIPHFGQRRAVTVKAYSTLGELPSEALARAKPTIDRIVLPAGYTLEYAGEAKELTQSRDEMSRVMAISLALIALTMVIQFNSLAKSTAVMLTVPLGLIGALIGLTLFHAPLGFMAMLAVVSLAGVIVSHIIVLSDAIEEGRASGLALRSALIRAGLVRMRPVLVTVLATAGGLVPLALAGGELWRPLTAVHICGLLVATVLTLFVLPVFYYLFTRRTV